MVVYQNYYINSFYKAAFKYIIIVIIIVRELLNLSIIVFLTFFYLNRRVADFFRYKLI